MNLQNVQICTFSSTQKLEKMTKCLAFLMTTWYVPSFYRTNHWRGLSNNYQKRQKIQYYSKLLGTNTETMEILLYFSTAPSHYALSVRQYLDGFDLLENSRWIQCDMVLSDYSRDTSKCTLADQTKTFTTVWNP